MENKNQNNPIIPFETYFVEYKGDNQKLYFVKDSQNRVRNETSDVELIVDVLVRDTTKDSIKVVERNLKVWESFISKNTQRPADSQKDVLMSNTLEE